MKTTDFTGTYDYEQEEANHAANYLLEDLALGYCTPHGFDAKVTKEQMHWRKHLPDTFDEFNKYFIQAIKSGYPSALASFNAL